MPALPIGDWRAQDEADGFDGADDEEGGGSLPVGTPPTTSALPTSAGANMGALRFADEAPIGMPPPPPPARSAVRDFGDQVWTASLGMGQNLLSAVSLAARNLEADPEIVQHIEKARRSLTDHMEATVSGMSPKAQEALHAKLFGGEDENGDPVPGPSDVGWGRYLGATVATAIPSTLLALVPGRIGVQVAKALAFGELDTGGAYGDLVDRVDKAKPDELMASPVYKALRDQGMPDVEARRQLVSAVAPTMAAMHMTVGTATGFGFGSLLSRGGKPLTTSLLGHMGEGAATMGAMTGGDEAARQYTDKQLNPAAEFSASRVAREFASGALGGALFGAGARALHGARGAEAAPYVAEEPAATERSTTSPVTPEVSEALGAALNPTPAEPPATRYQPFRADTGQAEMFPDFQMAPHQRGMPEGAYQSDLTDAAWGRPSGEAQGELYNPPTSPPGRGVPDDAAQGELFGKQKLGAAPTTVVEPGPVTKMVRDAAMGAPPVTAAEAPTTRKQFIDALVSAGVSESSVSRAKLPDLKVLWEKTRASKAAAEKAPVAKVEEAPVAPVTPVAAEPAAKAADITAKPAVEPSAPAPVAEKVTPVAGALAEQGAPAPAKKLTVADQLRAKRAEQKARMAARTEVAKPTAAVMEPEAAAPQEVAAPVTAEAALARPRAESMQGVREALDAQAKDITPIRKGDTEAVKRAINASVREIVDQLGGKEVTERMVHDAVARWATSDAQPIHGTRTRRADIADNVMRLLNGKTVAEYTGRAKRAGAEARAEAETRPSVYENEGVAKTVEREEAHARDQDAMRQEAIDNGAAPTEGEETSQGVANYGSEGERTYTGTATDKTRELSRLLSDVINGLKTPVEAREAYGQKAIGSSGRKREFDTFADYIHSRIKVATDPAARASLRQRIADTTQAEMRESRHVEKLQHELEALEAERNPDASTPNLELEAKIEKLQERITTASARGQKAGAESEETRRLMSETGDERVKQLVDILKALDKEPAPPPPVAKRTTGADKIAEHVAKIENGTRFANAIRAKLEIERLHESSASDAGAGRDAAWRAEHAYRLLGKGEADPARARMYDDAVNATNARMAELDDQADRIIKKHGSTPAEMDMLDRRIDKVPDNILNDVMAALREKYTPRAQLREAAPSGVTPGASRYVEAARDPVLNRFIGTGLKASDKYDVTYTLGDALRQITGARSSMSDMRPLQMLAKRLLGNVADIPIYTPARARELGVAMPDGKKAYSGATMFDGKDPSHIILDTDLPGQSAYVETVLHEALHVATARALDKAIAKQTREFHALQAIADELVMHAHEYGDLAMELGLDPVALKAAIQNPHETLAWMMSSPSLQTFAGRVRPSAPFRTKMMQLGYTMQPNKSVWRTFTDWVRRAVGIGGPGSASEHTLLDHVLRVGTDITDRAIEYNRRLLPTDPALRGAAEPLYRSTSSALSGAAQRTVDTIDPRGAGDKLRRGLLTAQTLDNMIRWNRRLFSPPDTVGFDHNPLVTFRDAQEAIAHSRDTFQTKYADRTVALGDKFNALPDNDKLGALMNDATIANVRLGDGADNSHLVRAEQRTALAEMQKRYGELSPEGKALYGEFRDHYAELHKLERDAQLASLVRQVLPDATEAQTAKLAEAMRTKEGIDKVIADKDDELSREFGSAWEANRTLVKGVAKFHQAGFVQGDYFPLRRYGNYVVHYGSQDAGDYGVEHFESRVVADRRRAELSREGVDGLSQVLDKRTNEFRAPEANSAIVDELAAAMRKKGATADDVTGVRDALNQVLMEHATRNERARNSLRRRGIQGASREIVRVLADHTATLAARIGHLEHGHERMQALRDMQLVADHLGRNGSEGQQITAQAVISELQKRSATDDAARGWLDGIARRASSLGFIQSLLSPSHIALNLVEGHLHGTVLMGARHGMARSGLALSKALGSLTPTMSAAGGRNALAAMGRGLKMAEWNLSRYARDQFVAAGADKEAMTDLFNRANNAGVLEHTFARELQRIANPTGIAHSVPGKAWQRFMELNEVGQHTTDIALKSAILKSAYDLELSKTNDHGKAADYAIDTLRKAVPNFQVSNKPRITTSSGPLGGWAGPMTQFKQYGFHHYGVVANLMREAISKMPGEERREARKALAGYLAVHSMMAGVLTWVADPLRYVGGLYDWITGAEKPHDYQADLRGAMSDWMGPELAEIVARGLPHAAGIDVHNRTGFADLLAVPQLESYDSKGVMKMLAMGLTGAAGQDAASMVGGAGKIVRGDVMGGLRDLLPRIVRDPLQAYQMGTEGLKDTAGRTILAPEHISALDVARKAVGFQPSQVSEFREGRAAVRQREEEGKADRTKLTSAWLNAKPEDRPDMMTAIREHNANYPEARVTMADLLRQQAARRMQAARPGAFGLKLPRTHAQDVTATGRFANVQ